MHLGRNNPTAALVMTITCVPHDSRLNPYNGPAMDTAGKKEGPKRQANPQKLQLQRPITQDITQCSSKQNQMEVACCRLTCQMAQRALIDWFI